MSLSFVEQQRVEDGKGVLYKWDYLHSGYSYMRSCCRVKENEQSSYSMSQIWQEQVKTCSKCKHPPNCKFITRREGNPSTQHLTWDASMRLRGQSTSCQKMQILPPDFDSLVEVEGENQLHKTLFPSMRVCSEYTCACTYTPSIIRNNLI